jgi:hypothetical protein
VSSPANDENIHLSLFLLFLRLSMEGEDKGEGVTVTKIYFIGNISITFHPADGGRIKKREK